MCINGVAIHINQFEPQLGDLRLAVDGYAVERLVMNVMDHPVLWRIANNDSTDDISLTVDPQAFV